MGDDAIVESSPIKASVVFKIVQIVLLAGILIVLIFKDFTVTSNPTVNNTFNPDFTPTVNTNAYINTSLNSTFNITAPNITVTPSNMTIIGRDITITLVNQTYVNYTCINATNETMCWK